MVKLTREVAKNVIDAISDSNWKSRHCQITARMEVDNERVLLVIDGNRCWDEAHVKSVLFSINKVCQLNIKPTSLFGGSDEK